MTNMAGVRFIRTLYSKEGSGLALACRRQSVLSNFVRRYANKKLSKPDLRVKQKSRLEAVFKTTGFIEGGYILLLFPAAAVALGTWQIRRRRWKLDLIDKIEQRTEAKPVPLPDNLDNLEELEYHPVVVRGKFDFTQEAVIAPRSQLNEDAPNTLGATRVPGVHIVTPFKLADRDLTILVNRGWLSNDEYKDMVYRKNGQEENEVEMIGILRLDDKRNKLMQAIGFQITSPSNEKGFLQRDVKAIAQALGTAPVFLDATEIRLKPGAPLGGQTRVNLPNNHGIYIFTWYGLAICTLWMWIDRYRRTVAPKNFTNVIEMQKRWKF